MENEKKNAPIEETELNKSNVDEEFIFGNSAEGNDGEAHQFSFESLLYDSDDGIADSKSDSDAPDYASFLEEYRQVISQNLSAAKEMHRDEVHQDSTVEATTEAVPEIYEDDEEDILVSLPDFKSRKDSSAANTELKLWDKDVSLSSIDEDNDVDSDILLPENEQTIAEEVEETAESFDLSYEDEDSDIQLTFSFNESHEPDLFAVDEDEEDNEPVYDPEKPRIIDWIFDIAELLVITFAAVILLTTFVFKHSVVDGPSMNDTLAHGDHLIISDLFYTPERGDIIVFEDYSTVLKHAVIKRVIGLPGDTVEIKDNGDGIYRVYINGTELLEDRDYGDAPLTHPGTWVVPEGEVFVMGDNRTNSTDSRDPRVGTIKIDCILGRVLFRFYPIDKFGSIN